ncbi:MAG: peptide ABC transporter substrate-binding protein [Clostridia bacterium]|nr:peptide ABC transporter substrate-binding protein [Clostridia bacterium]
MRKVLSLVLVVTILLSLCGCSSDDESKEIINYNLGAEPTSLDPQIASDTSAKIVIMNIFEGLTKIDKDDNVIPAMAASWESENNNTVFTFKLREDAVWADKTKTPVTAKDFLFAFKRVVDPKTNSALAQTLFCIKNASQINNKQLSIEHLGVQCIDDYTLRIELEYPYENFPRLMASTAAMPCNEEFFLKSSGQYGLEGNMLLSNGSFSLTNVYSWDHNKSISLSKSSYYTGPNEAGCAGIKFTIDTYYTNNLMGIKNQSIDAALIEPENVEAAKNEKMSLTSFKDTTWGLCFNLDKECFKNQNIRLGILSVLDRDSLVNNLPQSFEAANDIVMESVSIADKSYRELAGHGYGLVKRGDYRELVSAGLAEENLDQLPKTTIICLNSPVYTTIVSNIIEQINKNFNVFFNMEALDEDQFYSKLYSKTYQMALIPLSAANNSVYDMFLSFKSDNKSNISGLKSAEFDNILKNISLNPGTNSVPYCIEAEKYLSSNAIFYPISYQESFYAQANNVKDVVFYPFNSGVDFTFCRKNEK